MHFTFRDETRDLNPLTRREASGSFIQLSDGFTHYELSNPEVEQSVVFVHGFSVPYFIFDPTFEFLTRSGFRVLRYDLFGRGFSDRPERRYTLDLFVHQLDDLLDSLKLKGLVSLVGLSTGGPIVAAFTLGSPGRVDKLVLIDPIGAAPLPFAPALKVAALPFVGEALLSLVKSDQPFGKIVSRIFGREAIGEFRSRYIVQMKFKGFRRALLSSVRNGVLNPCRENYERLGKMDKPVLLFWGRQDPTVPFRHSRDLRKAIPSAEFHVIEHCGHIPHYEKAEEVNPILLNFLMN